MRFFMPVSVLQAYNKEDSLSLPTFATRPIIAYVNH
jgi:hypothetical protein